MFRTEIKRVPISRVAEINEAASGHSRTPFFLSPAEALKAGGNLSHGNREALKEFLKNLINHPDEAFPLMLVSNGRWNGHYLAWRNEEARRENGWKLTERALRDASEEGVVWTPLLDALERKGHWTNPPLYISRENESVNELYKKAEVLLEPLLHWCSTVEDPTELYPLMNFQSSVLIGGLAENAGVLDNRLVEFLSNHPAGLGRLGGNSNLSVKDTEPLIEKATLIISGDFEEALGFDPTKEEKKSWSRLTMGGPAVSARETETTWRAAASRALQELLKRGLPIGDLVSREVKKAFWQEEVLDRGAYNDKFWQPFRVYLSEGTDRSAEEIDELVLKYSQDKSVLEHVMDYYKTSSAQRKRIIEIVGELHWLEQQLYKENICRDAAVKEALRESRKPMVLERFLQHARGEEYAKLFARLIEVDLGGALRVLESDSNPAGRSDLRPEELGPLLKHQDREIRLRAISAVRRKKKSQEGPRRAAR